MTTIIETAIRYNVVGVLKGKRKATSATVFESMPVEIATDLMSDVSVDLTGIQMRIADRRPWFMVPSADLSPMTSSKDAIARSRSIVSNLGRSRNVTIDLTRDVPPSMPEVDATIALDAGSSLNDLFSRVDWSDRNQRMETARADASRARFVDGVLCTDRFEPVFLTAVDTMETDRFRWFVQDVVDGSRLVRGQEWKNETFGIWKDAHMEVAVQPVAEEWFGEIDWESDPSIGFGLSILKTFQSFQDGSSTEFERDLGYGARRTISLLSAVDQGVLAREKTGFDRSDLEEAIANLETGMSNVTKPKFAFRVEQCSNAIRTVRTLQDRMDDILPVPEPDDLAAIVSPVAPRP